VEKKGFLLLIEALNRLERDTFHLMMVTTPGDPGYESLVRGLIEQRSLSSSVTILDQQPHEKIIALMQQSHLFVLPCLVQSNRSRDGIPNVFIESLALELPVLSTNISGIPEVVQNKQTGLLVSPNDSVSLAERIRWCQNHHRELKLYGKNGRKLVSQQFDIRKNMDTLEEIFLHRA